MWVILSFQGFLLSGAQKFTKLVFHVESAQTTNKSKGGKKFIIIIIDNLAKLGLARLPNVFLGPLE